MAHAQHHSSRAELPEVTQTPCCLRLSGRFCSPLFSPILFSRYPVFRSPAAAGLQDQDMLVALLTPRLPTLAILSRTC